MKIQVKLCTSCLPLHLILRYRYLVSVNILWCADMETDEADRRDLDAMAVKVEAEARNAVSHKAPGSPPSVKEEVQEEKAAPLGESSDKQSIMNGTLSDSDKEGQESSVSVSIIVIHCKQSKTAKVCLSLVSVLLSV